MTSILSFVSLITDEVPSYGRVSICSPTPIETRLCNKMQTRHVSTIYKKFVLVCVLCRAKKRSNRSVVPFSNYFLALSLCSDDERKDLLYAATSGSTLLHNSVSVY